MRRKSYVDWLKLVFYSSACRHNVLWSRAHQGWPRRSGSCIAVPSAKSGLICDIFDNKFAWFLQDLLRFLLLHVNLRSVVTKHGVV
jgi:hypothetical protein